MSQRSPLDHLAAVRAALGSPTTITVALADALGATLASDVTAVTDSPPFDNSQMDGFALPAVGARTWPVGPTIAAGDAPGELAGHALPIMTGAAVPAGTAAIVPVERCRPDTFDAALAAGDVDVPEVAPGTFIRTAGSDLHAGELVVPAGSRVTPVVIGALASQGIAEVTVVAPTVVLVTGGAEVGSTGPASIPDANGPLLTALCSTFGIRVACHLHTDDDPQAWEKQLAQAIATHRPDAVITSGGISHGRFEVVRQVLSSHGWFGHVAQQPGGPQGLATYEATPVICLPGNPISTLVSFRLFALPALLGRADFGGVTSVLATPVPVTGLPDKVQFRRAITHGATTRLLGGASSHLLAQAATATALLEVPAGAELADATAVTVYPLYDLPGPRHD